MCLQICLKVISGYFISQYLILEVLFFLFCFQAPSFAAHVLTGLFTAAISLWPFVSPLLPRKHKHNCYCAQEVLSGLRQPVAVVHCGDGSQRLFVLEREGIVRILNHDLELIKEPFLDIHKLVQSGLKVGIQAAVLRVSCGTRTRIWTYFQFKQSVNWLGLVYWRTGRSIVEAQQLKCLHLWKRVGNIWCQHKSLQSSVCSPLGFDCNNYTKQAAIHQTWSRLIITLLPAN